MEMEYMHLVLNTCPRIACRGGHDWPQESEIRDS